MSQKPQDLIKSQRTSLGNSLCNCTISCQLFKKSLSTGSFPQTELELKLTLFLFLKRVRPSAQRIRRTISLPSLVFKCLERCVLNTLKIDCTRWQEIVNMDSLEGNYASPTFSRPRGLPTRRGKTGGHNLYRDMFKAFDKVNHGCLLQKLRAFGLEAAFCSCLALT